MLSGADRKGSIVRGDVFVVDEDTDLLDPIFQNGEYINPLWKPSGNGGTQKGKPEISSKHLEENITTEKKKDSRTSSLFPGKPSDDIIDLGPGNTPKKPSYPRTSTDDQGRTVSPTAQVISSDPSAKPLDEKTGSITTQSTTHSDVKHEDRENPGTVTIVSIDGDLVRSSDGQMYRLQKGGVGRMGRPGPEVSGLMMLYLL